MALRRQRGAWLDPPRARFYARGCSDYGSGPSPARVFHNEAAPSPGIVARGVARVDKLYTQVTSCDVEAAVFSSSLLDLPFDGTNTFLVRTDYGSVFKLGAGTDNTSTIEVSALRLR